MVRSSVFLFTCLFALASVVTCDISKREVDKARAEFYDALQEAVQELMLLPEADMEAEYDELLESLEGDDEAIAHVKDVFEDSKLEAMVSLQVMTFTRNAVFHHVRVC
jgi:putative heme degradation protein